MKRQPDLTPPAASAKPRRSFWRNLGGGSLSISLVLHVFLLAGAVIWVFQVIPPAEKNVSWTAKGGGNESRAAETQVTKQRVQMTRSNLPRVSAKDRESAITLPELAESAPMTSLASLGEGNSMNGIGNSGGGIGAAGWTGGSGITGGGESRIFIMIPENMRKRCSKSDRLARLQENGGTPACEEAVVKSLRWLKANQNADGSWGKDTRAAMTGLVLLSYFGHCETPLSEEFGDSCMRGIVYLVNVGLKNEGKLSSNFTANHWSYEHAIATYALGEAATFCKQGKIEIPSLMEVTEQAGQFIIDNQNKNGGWAYLYSKEGGHTDVSVAGWQIQALKACSHTNIEFRRMRSCINKGLDYLNRCQNENGGFGYTGTKVGETDYFTLTGVGILCNQMWDKGTRPGVRKAASYILENTRFDYNTEFCDLYGHYYESQAMMQRGGDEWKRYNELFRDQLLDNQDLDGSWKTPGGGKKPRATAATWQGDKLYRTCLCTLMLEVYYRFLNTGGGTSERPQF